MLRKLLVALVAVVVFSAAAPAAAQHAWNVDTQHPTAATSRCKVTMFAGEFFGSPFIWWIPDQRDLYDPCLILGCLYTVRGGRHCALMIMEPNTAGQVTSAANGSKFAGGRVCMAAPQPHHLATYDHLGRLVALGYCDM